MVLKYGHDTSNWVSRVVHGSYGVSLWKYIKKGWERFSAFIKYEVGCGTRIRFWLDVWCGELLLRAAFPYCFI